MKRRTGFVVKKSTERVGFIVDPALFYWKPDGPWIEFRS
jgi:hypothetical protein